ncbi:MAG: class I SAM-dependent methyltransferase [Oscillospiraceae bacterium]|jgi:ubiquinone/menaquinone biosynthesis C-methylase UbiE|nr:class I SAM-dependent methyltransferase [Oscillospiraceae bacterium]
MAYAAFAQVYDSLTQNVEYEKRAEYLCSLLSFGGVSGGILLDLACGTGSLSVEFCRRGFEVIGVDSSPDMLSIARNKLCDHECGALLLCQDMAELDLYGTVNCAVCALDSLNHITDEKKLRRAFERVSLFLEPGGVFVFDMNTLHKHESVLADNAFVYEADGVFCAWRNAYAGRGRVDICLDIFMCGRGGYERFTEEFSEQAYSEEFIKDCLCGAGFELLAVYDDMTLAGPRPDSERIYYTAKKSG